MQLNYKQLDNHVGERLDSFFKIKNGFVEVNPGQVIMPIKFTEIGEEVMLSSVRESDVWLVSYPRTGSTWAQEMVWLLGNKLDYTGARHLQQLRSPLLELTALIYEDHNEWLTNTIGNSVQLVNSLPSPRFIKSHLPWQLLPQQLQNVKPKTIYIARNPKDMCVSYFHYCILVHGLVGTFEDFCNLFLSDKAPIGSMWAHMLAFWNQRNEPHILFLKYEDMKKDLPSTIIKCAKFLGVDDTLTTEDITKMCDYLNFKNMQKNPAVNLEPIIHLASKGKKVNTFGKFIRKGQVGDWKNYMSDEMSDKFDSWIELNTSGSDLQFEYE